MVTTLSSLGIIDSINFAFIFSFEVGVLVRLGSLNHVKILVFLTRWRGERLFLMINPQLLYSSEVLTSPERTGEGRLGHLMTAHLSSAKNEVTLFCCFTKIHPGSSRRHGDPNLLLFQGRIVWKKTGMKTRKL